jgi:hypothetical protein
LILPLAGRAATALAALLPLLALALHAPALYAQGVPAEAEPAEQVHWALGAFFGTGWYEVEDNRSVFVLRIPPRQRLREASLGADGVRRLGVEFIYPVAVGLSKLEEAPDFFELDNFASISFTPGVELEVPVAPAWALRPYLHLGYGWEVESGAGAAIWYGGVKSRYRLGSGRQWSLLNKAYFAGYKPEFENRGRYGGIMGGLEWNRRWRGEPRRTSSTSSSAWRRNSASSSRRLRSRRSRWRWPRAGSRRLRWLEMATRRQ